ncbi:hypothetical protein [Pseudaestuariivita atlantica]|uniref:Lectin-like protein BA14k n=1 Tax=Pseudaestuariivita atlantica TaxID=1317121 RepID=A0A0L1JS62_9RHOB|nr:hypothetical protein [Pseudaestuariivita atlantica]KNG94537.1 hypothetical protein ATO11_03760 [Pseudaestuariivita atlantica]
MSRKFITTIAAAAVALTSINVTPAVAGSSDRDRLARFLAGAATLVIIGSAISNAQAQPRTSTQTHYVPHNHPVPRTTHPKPKPKPRAVHNGTSLLPRYCIRYAPTRDGRTYRTFGARCLKKNYRHADRLPRVCRESVKMRGKWRSGYKIRCLQDYGFRIARH